MKRTKTIMERTSREEGKEVNGTFFCKRELFLNFRIKATNSQVLNTFLFDYAQMWSENFLL